MVELIDYIDNSIKNCITEVKQFGLCHLIEGLEEKYPATVERRATKAIPDDRFKAITYHRLLNGLVEEREDLSFGSNPVIQNTQKIRMVVFVKLEDSNKIDDILNALTIRSFSSTNYYFANMTRDVLLNRDRATIWNDEFSKAYQDKYQMVWHVYAIEYNLEYLKCNVCV